MQAFLLRKVKMFLVNLRAPPKDSGDFPKMQGVDVFANSILSFV